MKIPMHYSLEVAWAIVNKISLPKKVADRTHISSWSNGREQGLAIESYANSSSKTAVIAQQRNGDQILIIYGNGQDFDVTTNMPSDKLWDDENSKKYFSYNQQKQAANFIKKFLINS